MFATIDGHLYPVIATAAGLRAPEAYRAAFEAAQRSGAPISVEGRGFVVRSVSAGRAGEIDVLLA